MAYSLSLRPRALAELRSARDRYAHVGHAKLFAEEVDTVLEAIRAMPARFPIVHANVHRALLRTYPFAVFFRIRPTAAHVVVLAVFPQRGDPSGWPAR